MIAEVKGARLLQGFRGRPAADLEALEDTLVRVSSGGCAGRVARDVAGSCRCVPEVISQFEIPVATHAGHQSAWRQIQTTDIPF
jgi:hypothetical protein